MEDIFNINAPALDGNPNAVPTTSTVPVDFTQSPAYLQSADNHNLGNGNSSWYDPTTWNLGEKALHTGYFAAASLASGVNSIYNTGAAIAKWAGADVEQNDVSTQLSAVDSDLGAYYNQNRDSIDLAGFIATSFIPGIGGIKVLNAGQKVLAAAKEGMVGANIAKSVGLLATDAATYAAKAGEELAATNATYTLINRNVQQSLLRGAGQAALESAAFEVAVTASMKQSPILQDQDFKDILSNVATGAVTGGLIGGAISGVLNKGVIKGIIGKADFEAKPLTAITSYPGMSSSEKVVAAASDLEDLKNYMNQGPSPLPNAIKLAEDKAAKLNNIARSATRELSGSDDAIGNMVADANLGSQTVLQDMHGVQDIGRMSSRLGTEEAILSHEAALSKYNAKVVKRGGLSGDLETPPENTSVIKYVKLLGENAGDITEEAPKVLRIADTVVPKKGLFSSNTYESAVQDTVDSYKFNTTKAWDPLEDAGANNQKWEARYIWAKDQTITPNMPIHENDIPLLEQAYLQKVPVTVLGQNGFKDIVVPGEEMLQRLEHAKNDVAQALQDKYSSVGLTNPDIAFRTNVKLGYLEGTSLDASTPTADIFALQDAQSQYNASCIAKGLQSATDPVVDISHLPTYAKVGYSTEGMQDVDGNVVSGMAAVRAKYNVYQSGVNNAFSQIAGDAAARFVHPTDNMLLKVSRNGAGPGNFSFAGGKYLSPEAWAEQTGAATHDLRAQLVTQARETLNPVMHKLSQNLTDAVEFQAINDKILSTAEDYILNDAGTGLISKKIKEYRDALAKGGNPLVPKIQEGAPQEIIFRGSDTAEAITAHMRVSSNTTDAVRTMQAAQGITNTRDPNVFYPIRPNEKNYPFKAFVVDDTVTGVGHMSMLHAADESTLQQMIDKVNATTDFKTITVGQSEEYHKALGDWEYDKSLHNNYIDSSLKRNGISSPFYQQTDPQKIAEDILSHHDKQQSVLTSELVNAKYGKEFDYLRNLSDQFGGAATSKAGNATVIAAESDAKNPYLSYVRTALDINQSSSAHPLWSGMQQKLDSIVSKAWDTVTNSVRGAQTVEDLDNVNSALQSAGITSGYRDAATEILANHSAPRGALNTFVRRANSILAGLLIRTDTMEAITNAVGHNVMLGAETNHIVGAIKNGRSDLAGDLADLMKVTVPGTSLNGTTTAGDMVTSPIKLISKAIKNWTDPSAVSGSGENLRDFYNRIGQSSNIRDALHATLGQLALNGTEDAGALANRTQNAFSSLKDIINGTGSVGEKVLQAGEKYSGNSYIHAFNNFITADVMRQITDLGIKAGVIGEQEQLSYINTFSNRVRGNILASQRPLMFQGPVGNAVGLFQSYQLNLMQQAFRYVSDGAAKDAGMLLGLQGTLFGANGLPGFNYLNQHLVGEAAGNRNHTDVIGATYGALGKQLGDWFVYGAPSNIMGNSLYTRGDLNPHSATIIPTSLDEIPALRAVGQFYGNLKNAAIKVNDGGNLWQTFLQGIEHNGLSRPLAGLAQTLQAAGTGGTAFSTTAHGDIMGANDIFSLATAARLMGGKPLDEAIAHDEIMRLQAYAAKDSLDRKDLSQSIKSTVLAGNQPTPGQMSTFAQEYAALGGKQQNFSREVMKLTLAANTSQANIIAQDLKSPRSVAMQRVMGGDPIMDGRNINATGF